MSATECFNAANWQNAIANDFFNQGVFFREHSKHYFGLAYEWNQKATWYFHAGDATAATWSKAVADDYSKKAVANAKAADERFAQAAFTRAAAQDSVNRGQFFAALNDTGPTYPEGTFVSEPVATPSRSSYNCTGAAKTVRNKRKIESSVAKTDLFWYRIVTHWKFCNGKVTELYPAEADQDLYGGGSEAKWKFVRREKIRANCYGPEGTRTDPERCAWTYRYYWWMDLPTVGPIDFDKHKSTCVTTQVKGNGAHYRHGSCDLRAWSGPHWGGGEY